MVLRAIDIDAENANITYYDRSKPEGTPGILIANEAMAKKLIEEHKSSAGDSSVYYLFLFPRPAPDEFTNRVQIKKLRQYKEWFKDVDNSLKVTLK